MAGFDNFDETSTFHGPMTVRTMISAVFGEQLKNGEKDINNTEALEEIIQFYFDHAQFEEALHFVDRLISFEPFSGDAWQRKGMIPEQSLPVR